jgi:hypothetical protein
MKGRSFIGGALLLATVCGLFGQSSTHGSGSKPSVTAKPQHTVAEITDWLVANSITEAGYQEHGNSHFIRGRMNVDSSNPCKLHTTYERAKIGGDSFKEEIDYDVDLSMIDPERTSFDQTTLHESIVVLMQDGKSPNDDDPSAGPLYLVKLQSRNRAESINFTIQNSLLPGYKQPRSGRTDLFFVATVKPDLPQRMATAFHDAIQQCGGKSSIGNIY